MKIKTLQELKIFLKCQIDFTQKIIDSLDDEQARDSIAKSLYINTKVVLEQLLEMISED